MPAHKNRCQCSDLSRTIDRILPGIDQVRGPQVEKREWASVLDQGGVVECLPAFVVQRDGLYDFFVQRREYIRIRQSCNVAGQGGMIGLRYKNPALRRSRLSV